MAGWRGGRHGPPFARWGGPFFGGGAGSPVGRGHVAARRPRCQRCCSWPKRPLNGYQLMQEIEKRSEGPLEAESRVDLSRPVQLEDEGTESAPNCVGRPPHIRSERSRGGRTSKNTAASWPRPGSKWPTRPTTTSVPCSARCAAWGWLPPQIGHLGNANQIAKARSSAGGGAPTPSTRLQRTRTTNDRVERKDRRVSAE